MSFEIVDAPHPFACNTQALLQSIRVFVLEVADSFCHIHALMMSGQDLGIAVHDQRRIRSGHFQNRVGKFLDGVLIPAANVVGFAGFEIIDDICQGANRVGQKR